MKPIKILFLLVLVLHLGSSFSGCKKDQPITPTDLLIAHAWKPISDNYNGLETLSDCDKDDAFTFKTDGTVERNYGADQCAPPEATESFPWSFSSDEKTLTVDDVPFTVTVLTENSLVLTVTDGLTIDVVTWASY